MRTERVLLAVTLILTIAAVAGADGMLIPGPPDRPMPEVPNFTVKYHHVTVEIEDQVSTTHIDQVFINEADREVEATYLFPLPANSVVRDFAVVADGKRMEAKLYEKDEAVRIYEEIMRQRKDPALFQYVGNNTYQARIYPIPAGGERRIEITYSELLSFDADIVEYVYPLSTEQFSNKPVKETVFNCSIVSKDPIASIYCPSHNVDVDKTDQRHATVSYEENDTRPDRDLRLYYSVSSSAIGTHLLTYKEKGEDGFFMLLAAPTVEREQASVPKNVVFVIDRSGSMSGEKIEQAREALTFCVNSLEPEDEFEIISFSDNVKSFGSSLSEAKPARIKAARDWISGLEATGSTDIDAAMALAMKRRRANRPNYIVMLTDGLPTAGETDLGSILSNLEDRREKMAEAATRVFVFGVGYDVDTHFLDKMSLQNNGIATYVRPSESIEAKVSSFYAKISRPVLTDLAVDFGEITAEDFFPRELPDLFHGSQIVLLGRYDKRTCGRTAVTLTGHTADGSHDFAIEALFPNERTEAEYIPVLWASRKIGWLLDEIRLKGENKELVDEVVRLGTEYGILTEYTAFLAEEGEVATAEEATDRAAAPMAAGGAQTMGGYAISQRDNNQAMQKAANMSAQNAYMDEEGDWQQVAGIRNIGQRGFIEQAGQWVDSRLRIGTAEELKPEIEVQAFSEAHFQLAREFPGVNSMLSASDNLLVLINGHVVQIGTEGKETLTAAEIEALQAPATDTGDDVGVAPAEPVEEGVAASPAAQVLGGLAGVALAFAASLTRMGG